MKNPLSKSIVHKLLDIAENSDASIILKYAKEVFGNELQNLLDEKAIEHFRSLKDIEVFDGDSGRVVEVQRQGGKNVYFSSIDGYVDVKDEDIALYKINFTWFVKKIMYALDIADRHEPNEILHDSIWSLGQHRVDKQLINFVIVRNIKQSTVFNSLAEYLNNYHSSRDPALVIALDHQVPEYFQLPGQNQFIKIGEIIQWDAESFELNSRLIVGKMGGSLSRIGFAPGYRTLVSNGKTYKFTPKQSEALEFMVNENKPLHQTEILAQTSSSQGNKLRDLFKGKAGKIHEAWGTIIKSDNKGNYWLEY